MKEYVTKQLLPLSIYFLGGFLLRKRPFQSGSFRAWYLIKTFWETSETLSPVSFLWKKHILQPYLLIYALTAFRQRRQFKNS